MKPSYDFGYKTLEQVVEQINNSPVQGFEDHTPEFLAAAYACDAQEESGYEITQDAIEAHLDILSENGAEFDYQEAVKVALAD